MLQKDNSSFAGLKCNKMAFFYYNSGLYGIACYYTEADVGDPDTLIQGLTKIYGAPKMYASNQTSLDNLASGTKTLCDWKIGEDTVIKVVQLSDAQSTLPKEEKFPYLCIVSFENTFVEKQMEEALNKSATEPEK